MILVGVGVCYGSRAQTLTLVLTTGLITIFILVISVIGSGLDRLVLGREMCV